MPTIKRQGYAWLLLLLLQPQAHAHTTEPVVIGVFSAYQSDLIRHKISALSDSVTQTLRRPVYVMTIDDAASLRQLLQSKRRALVFLPAALASIDKTQLIAVAQTDVPLALYARPGPATLADLKTVSIPESVSGAELLAELGSINPRLAIVRQPIGVQQLRTLMSGTVDGAVMSVGLFDNLSTALRGHYVRRYSFAHQLRIQALCSDDLSADEQERLQSLLLALPAKAHEQLRGAFGISGFEALRMEEAAR